MIRIFIIDCDITIMYKLMCPFDPIYPTKSPCFNVSNVGLGNQLVKIFKDHKPGDLVLIFLRLIIFNGIIITENTVLN